MNMSNELFLFFSFFVLLVFPIYTREACMEEFVDQAPCMPGVPRTAREAVMARFPKADLSSRKECLNQSIDQVLSGS